MRRHAKRIPIDKTVVQEGATSQPEVWSVYTLGESMSGGVGGHCNSTVSKYDNRTFKSSFALASGTNDHIPQPVPSQATNDKENPAIPYILIPLFSPRGRRMRFPQTLRTKSHFRRPQTFEFACPPVIHVLKLQ